MKVTFIQPYYHNIWEAIGIAYISAYIEKHYRGHIELNFFQGYFDNDKTIIEGSIKSDIVAFSCTSPAFNQGLILANEIKKINPKIKTVFGGNHVSALSGFISEECIDQMVVGEGEKAFLEILEGNNERIVNGKPVTFDELSWPDRDMIKNERTVDLCQKMTNQRIASFQANRVCPFRCRYCSERVITGIFNKKTNPIRSRDVKDLIDEIEFVVRKYKLDFFKFVDATFNTSSEYVTSFCEEKIKRNLTCEWECMIHAGIANKEMFAILKKANCNQIDVGCESGSPKVLRDMKKGVNIDKIIKVFDWAKEYSIKRRAFFIIGLPTETKEDILLTEQLAIKLQPDVLGVTILCPYPGCDYYDHDKMKDIDWQNTDEYSNDFWHTDYFSSKELKEGQRYLTDKFKDYLAWHHSIIKPKVE